MGTSLIGLLPQNTYSGLIKVGNNTALNTTLKTLSDGAGNDLPMQASTTGINFTGTVSGVASGVAGAIQFSNGSAFASDAANLFWDNTNKRLGIGLNTPVAGPFQVKTTQSNANGSIIFTNNTTATILAATDTGSALTQLQFRASSYNFTDTAGMRIASTGYATTPTAMLQIVGSGSTSATTSLLVQNSAGTAALKVDDSCNTSIGASGISARLNIINTNGSAAAYIAGSGNGGVVEFNSISGAGIICNDGYGNTNMFLGGLSTPSVSIGKASSAVASALLEMVSTTKGFLPPRMTTTQKNAIASPAEGLQMYDSTAKSPAYYDGTNWGYTGGALQNASGNSGTLNISFAAGNIVNLTLNATTTLAFSNAVIGTYIIQVTQGATGSNSLAYPASVKWAGGTPPTFSTAVGKTDILTFYYDGTFYYGNYSLNY